MTLPTLIEQVAANCQVASAGQAGQFSLCGTLLRLRQLYKWEHGLPPWREPEPAAVIEWIEAKERTWEALEGAAWRASPGTAELRAPGGGRAERAPGPPGAVLTAPAWAGATPPPVSWGNCTRPAPRSI